MPPTSARAGLFADAAPVKRAGDVVVALAGATVGRLETVLTGATGVVGVGCTTGGAEEGGELAGGAGGAGAGGAGDGAGGAQLAHVAGGELAEYCEALKVPGITGAGDDDVQAPQVVGEDAAGDDTGAAGDDGQGPHVVDEVSGVGETGITVVWELVVVLTSVLVDQTPQEVLLATGVAETGVELLLSGATGVDDHTAHVSDDEELLAGVEGLTGVKLGVVSTLLGTTGDDNVSQVPQDEVAGVVSGEDGVEDMSSQLPQDELGKVLEFPSQLPQDEPAPGAPSSGAPLPLPWLPRLPEAPCLSRLSTTPAITELARTSRTNDLFTMLATCR